MNTPAATSATSATVVISRRLALPALVMLGAILFSSKGILVKLMYAEGLTPSGVLALRMSVALPFYLVMVIFLGQGFFSLKAKDWFAMAVLSFVGYFLCSLINFTGLQFISVGLERVLLFSYPSLVLLGSSLFQHRRPSLTLCLASALSWFGLFLVIREEIQLGDNPQWVLLGSGLVLLSAIIYASYILIAKPIIMRIGSHRYTSCVMCLSCIFILINYGTTGGGVEGLMITPRVIVYSIIIGVFGTVVPTYILSYGLSKIPPTSYAVISSVGPVATIGLSLIMLGSAPEPLQIAGMGISILGSLLASMDKR